jgi:hypothetical protein
VTPNPGWGAQDWRPSLDRLLPTEVHTVLNCSWISHKADAAKNNLNEGEVNMMAAYMAALEKTFALSTAAAAAMEGRPLHGELHSLANFLDCLRGGAGLCEQH